MARIVDLNQQTSRKIMSFGNAHFLLVKILSLKNV